MRAALVIACGDYAEPKLRPLRAPAQDAEALVHVLANRSIGDYEVKSLINKPSHVLNEEIEGFFADSGRADLLLLYFSCHGIKDESGRLYFAAHNTKLNRLAATSVSSVFVNEQIDRSRSRQKVLLLDCCYSGAFARGLAPRSNGSVQVRSNFQGQGLAVITASDSMEYAWEEGELTLDAARPSIFTTQLVNGLESGEADLDEDGKISVRDLYEYVFEQVRRVTPNQTPTKFEHGLQGELYIATSTRPLQPAPLPIEMQQLFEVPLVGVRMGLVEELTTMLELKHRGLALAARKALERLSQEDDSNRVRQAAELALRATQSRLQPVGRQGLPQAMQPALEMESESATVTPSPAHQQMPVAPTFPRLGRISEAIHYQSGGEERTSRYHGSDLVIAMHWNHNSDGFDVILRFEMLETSTDLLETPSDPLRVDEGKLANLWIDESAYGEALTQMVLRPADVGPFYARARTVTESAGLRLNLRLLIDAPLRFQGIRWESLRDPSTGSPLATGSNVLFSRYLANRDWRPIPALPEHGLSALIAISAPSNIHEYCPKGRVLGPINVTEERMRAQAALANFDAMDLDTKGATLSNIIDALRQGIDVLYLVCHGFEIDGEPALLLERQDKTADVVDGRRFMEALSSLERPPTVVMLPSCQTAGDHNDASTTEDGTSRLGPTVIAAGVAAVIAVQGKMTTTTAATFGSTFFTELAMDGLVDRAMATARQAIADRSDWWAPVLFSRVRSGRLYYHSDFTRHSTETWEALGAAIQTGRFTPVLGPGMADSIFDSQSEIARRWAQRLQLPISPASQGSLAKVAHYVAARRGAYAASTEFSAQLFEVLRDRRSRAGPGGPFSDLSDDALKSDNPELAVLEAASYLRAKAPTDPYGIVASLPAKIYITTDWVDLLQDALRECERRPTTLCFPWNDRADWNNWQQQGELEPPTTQNPWVYHLFGRLHDPDSIVLTEDDYLEWLTAWTDRRSIIPPAVLASLAKNSMLFLGYDLDNLDFRVVLQGIRSSHGSLLHRNIHVGVQSEIGSQVVEPEEFQEYLESSLGQLGIRVYWGRIEGFVGELRRRTKLAI